VRRLDAVDRLRAKPTEDVGPRREPRRLGLRDDRFPVSPRPIRDVTPESRSRNRTKRGFGNSPYPFRTSTQIGTPRSSSSTAEIRSLSSRIVARLPASHGFCRVGTRSASCGLST
jgi:hypothetical protein